MIYSILIALFESLNIDSEEFGRQLYNLNRIALNNLSIDNQTKARKYSTLSKLEKIEKVHISKKNYLKYQNKLNKFAINKLYGIIQMGVVLLIPVIAMYNGQRGHIPKMNKIMKWLFYLYYPMHLFIIGYIQYIR